MTPGTMFIYGFFGAFAVDFQKVYLEAADRNSRIAGLPRVYRQPGFWMLRLVHSFTGGFLAVAWGESFLQMTPITLMAVGGAADLILQKFGNALTRKF